MFLFRARHRDLARRESLTQIIESRYNLSLSIKCQACFRRHISVKLKFVEFSIERLSSRKFEAKTGPRILILFQYFISDQLKCQTPV